MRWGVASALLIAGCTTYNQSGELVRHHIGYVRVITPAAYSEQAPVQSLGVSTFGLWVDVDRRNPDQRSGSGAGFGYRSDYRAIVPYTCRIIFRVKTMEQFDATVALLSTIKDGGDDLCVIREEAP